MILLAVPNDLDSNTIYVIGGWRAVIDERKPFWGLRIGKATETPSRLFALLQNLLEIIVAKAAAEKANIVKRESLV